MRARLGLDDDHDDDARPAWPGDDYDDRGKWMRARPGQLMIMIERGK